MKQENRALAAVKSRSAFAQRARLSHSHCANEKATRQLGGLLFKGE
jgi:hypothetical protein